MTLEQAQQQFDVEKWNDSVESGKDLCGSYPRCAVCNKEEAYPCANAEARMNAPVKKTTRKPRAKKTVNA